MTDALRLPDFIIAGAAKSATTWLQRSLQQSAAIHMPDHEPHFFSRRYDKGIDTYLEELGQAPDGVLLGEKSNSYLTEPEAAARIHKHIPDVKLVFQLRNPVARAYSDYCMLLRRGEVDADIAQHLDPDKAAEGRFLGDGRYAHHLQRFYDLFAPEQILVLRYEDVLSDPEGQLAKLGQHLGLSDALAPPLQSRVKDARATAVPRPLRKILAPFRPLLDPLRETAPMVKLRNLVARPQRYPAFEPSLKSAVRSYYQPQIDELSKLTATDFDIWRTDKG
ncbi:sulfotransferase domain-containing protein [Paracoccus aurantiacus]|uniref:Sulfotransferase domain-containing protein n=1 Tax=Paracoccus aurantiacus TaxID=2599412 RepID=A0A5C6RV69_9RHOB|nr:sulfotransferase [Paracoccus aurantiacus]TXB66426.1 sulfotransferase domain-containing protein [Paracoccus aurantiacus]